MRFLSHFASEMPAVIRGLLFDVDDTLTTDGRLTADAYGALESLKRAGYITVPITGRPAGWCDHIARMWPVDGVVGENGAFYFRHDHVARKMLQRFTDSAETRAQNRQQLAAITAKILREIPGTALASDQHYREADIAIDFCEDVSRLPQDQVQLIKDMMEASGLTAKISSIHVNGWFGQYDKLSTTQLLMREAFAIDAATLKNEFVFIGDSPNDAPMFAFFPHSVGVANVHDFAGQLDHHPAYVTPSRCGKGFTEVAAVLLAAAERA